jgi:hypothetical protein
MTQELKAYNPTWRDWLSQMMLGDGRPSPERARFVEGITGSRGMGTTGMGLADVTPLGIGMAIQDSARAGDMQGAAMAVMPGARRGRQAIKEVGKEVQKMVVALRKPDGEVLYGKPGQNHGDLAAEHNYFPKSEDDSGFAVPGGDFKDRRTAGELLAASEPQTVAKLKKSGPAQPWGKLEATDLNRARGDALSLDAINDIIAQTKANGGYSINMKGKAPKGGFMVGKFSNDDARTMVIDGPLKHEHVNAFVKKNRETLDEPNTYIGSWFNEEDGKTYLDVSRNFKTAERDKAIEFGRGTKQLSIYDVDNKNTFDVPPSLAQTIETEHGLKLKPEELAKVKRFEKQGMDAEQVITMLGETAPKPKKQAPDIIPFGPGIGADDYRISTRYPHGPNRTADPLREHLKIGVDEMKQTPAFEHNANLIPTYPGFGNLKGLPPDEIVNRYVDQTSGNLQHLFNRLPQEMKDRSPRWYYGANRFVDAVAERHGVPRRSVSGATSALSPQKDWFQNASLAERAADVVFGPAGSKRATSEMFDWANNAQTQSGPLFNDVDHQLIRKLKGKRFNDLEDPTEQAIWLRMYDEAHNPRQYREITPEGELGPVVLDAKGNPKDVAWGSFNEISKAIQLLKSNGDMDIISSTLSPGHKTRSFYNDIEQPGDLMRHGGDPVIDTHAVGSAQLRSVSQKDPAVVHNFGSSLDRADQPLGWVPHSNAGFKSHGVKGTYGFLADSYRKAGNALGLSPLETQSPTWEGIRMRFPQEEKRGMISESAPDNVWRAYERGELTLDQARDTIVPEGSIGVPSWGQPGFGTLDPRRSSTYRR